MQPFAPPSKTLLPRTEANIVFLSYFYVHRDHQQNPPDRSHLVVYSPPSRISFVLSSRCFLIYLFSVHPVYATCRTKKTPIELAHQCSPSNTSSKQERMGYKHTKVHPKQSSPKKQTTAASNAYPHSPSTQTPANPNQTASRRKQSRES